MLSIDHYIMHKKKSKFFPLTIKKKYYIINLCLKYKDKFRS